MSATVSFRWTENVGVTAEALCPACSWRVTETDPVLMDTLYIDAAAHNHECEGVTQ